MSELSRFPDIAGCRVHHHRSPGHPSVTESVALPPIPYGGFGYARGSEVSDAIGEADCSTSLRKVSRPDGSGEPEAWPRHARKSRLCVQPMRRPAGAPGRRVNGRGGDLRAGGRSGLTWPGHLAGCSTEGLEYTGSLEISRPASLRTVMRRSGSIRGLSSETPMASVLALPIASASLAQIRPDGSIKLWPSLISKK